MIEEALRLIGRAHRLTWDELDLLDVASRRAFERDTARTEGLLPNIRQPELATLTLRATAKVAELDGYRQLLEMTAGLPQSAADAVLASFGRRVLSEPEHAILFGPWAEVVDDDPCVLDAAWSDAADGIRADFRDVPLEAWTTTPARGSTAT